MHTKKSSEDLFHQTLIALARKQGYVSIQQVFMVKEAVASVKIEHPDG